MCEGAEGEFTGGEERAAPPGKDAAHGPAVHNSLFNQPTSILTKQNGGDQTNL